MLQDAIDNVAGRLGSACVTRRLNSACVAGTAQFAMNGIEIPLGTGCQPGHQSGTQPDHQSSSRHSGTSVRAGTHPRVFLCDRSATHI